MHGAFDCFVDGDEFVTKLVPKKQFTKKILHNNPKYWKLELLTIKCRVYAIETLTIGRGLNSRVWYTICNKNQILNTGLCKIK